MPAETKSHKQFAIDKVGYSQHYNKTSKQVKTMQDIMIIFSETDFKYKWDILEKYYYYGTFAYGLGKLGEIYKMKTAYSKRRVELSLWRNGYTKNPLNDNEEIKPPSARTQRRDKQKIKGKM